MKALFSKIILLAVVLGGCSESEPGTDVPDFGSVLPGDMGSASPQLARRKIGGPSHLLTADQLAPVRGVRERRESLLESWASATVGRDGMGFGPSMPGWTSLSSLTGKTPWSPPTVLHGRVAARLYSIGVTVAFPVGIEGPSLRYLSLWLRPRGTRQAASVFLDDKPLGTIRLKSGWQKYTLPIGDAGLGPGEHKLRFWFRRTVVKRKRRSSADFAGAWFSATKASEPPEKWLNRDAQMTWYAGPPTRWSLDLHVPPNGEIRATAEVADGGPVDFSIQLSRDGSGTTELLSKRVDDGQTEQLSADLSRWSGQIVRLHFKTKGDMRAIESAAWTQIDVTRKVKTYQPLPAVKNVILFVVEGLWSDVLRLGRDGDFVDAPNLELLAGEGAVGLEAWSGGLSNVDAHRRILQPPGWSKSWVKTLQAAGIGTSQWTTNPRFSKELQSGFTSFQGPAMLDRKAGFEAEFRALDEWFYTRGRNRFFMYIDLAMPVRGRQVDPDEVFRSKPRSERVPEVTEGAVLSSDFWIGHIVAALNHYSLASETAIVVVGSATRTRGSYRGTTLSPARLSVPIIVWHPKMRTKPFIRTQVSGLDLSDIPQIVNELLGSVIRLESNPRTAAESLFYNKSLMATHSSAKTPYGWALRYADWLLWPRAAIKDRLWNRDNVNEPKNIDDYPIIVRALRRRAASTR